MFDIDVYFYSLCLYPHFYKNVYIGACDCLGMPSIWPSVLCSRRNEYCALIIQSFYILSRIILMLVYVNMLLRKTNCISIRLTFRTLLNTVSQNTNNCEKLSALQLLRKARTYRSVVNENDKIEVLKETLFPTQEYDLVTPPLIFQISMIVTTNFARMVVLALMEWNHSHVPV